MLFIIFLIYLCGHTLTTVAQSYSSPSTSSVPAASYSPAPAPSYSSAPAATTAAYVTSAPATTTGYGYAAPAASTSPLWLGTWQGTGQQDNYNAILQANGISVAVYGTGNQNIVNLCQTATGYSIERIIPAEYVDDVWAFTAGGYAFTRFSPKFASNLTMVYFNYGDKLIAQYTILSRYDQVGYQYIKTSPDGTMLEMTFTSNGVEGSYWFTRAADACPTVTTTSAPSPSTTAYSYG